MIIILCLLDLKQSVYILCLCLTWWTYEGVWLAAKNNFKMQSDVNHAGSAD